MGRSTRSDKPWGVEDLEEQLKRKVELLEKERKALRLKTEKNREEIDHGITKLQHRILGLEEGEPQKERKKEARFVHI